MTKAREQAGIGRHGFRPRWIDKNGREIMGGDTVRLEFSVVDKDTMKEQSRGETLAHALDIDGTLKLVGLLGEDLDAWLDRPGEPLTDVEVVEAGI